MFVSNKNSSNLYFRIQDPVTGHEHLESNSDVLLSVEHIWKVPSPQGSVWTNLSPWGSIKSRPLPAQARATPDQYCSIQSREKTSALCFRLYSTTLLRVSITIWKYAYIRINIDKQMWQQKDSNLVFTFQSLQLPTRSDKGLLSILLVLHRKSFSSQLLCFCLFFSCCLAGRA